MVRFLSLHHFPVLGIASANEPFVDFQSCKFMNLTEAKIFFESAKKVFIQCLDLTQEMCWPLVAEQMYRRSPREFSPSNRLFL